MDEQIYTAEEIAQILRQEGDDNVSLRTVRYYTQERILPALKQVGNRLAYTEEHLVAMRAARRLAKSGRSLQQVREFLSRAEEALVYSVAAKPDLLEEIRHEGEVESSIRVGALTLYYPEGEVESSIRVGALTLYYPRSFPKDKLKTLVRLMDETQKD